MNLNQIRRTAKERGIKTSKRTKLQLVRSIQRDEGNFDCFATAFDGECDQHECLWRRDCFASARKLQ